MKRKIVLTAALLALIMGFALLSCATTGGGDGAGLLSLQEAIEQSAAKFAAELPAGTRLAIVGFSSEHENLSNYIMDELEGALMDGDLEVANRRNLPFVYKELGFQMSGDVDEDTAVSIGKFLGAPYVVFGQLVKAGSSRRYRVSVINVETAVQESSTRLSVRDDRGLRSLIADLGNAPLVAVAANYGETGDSQPKSTGAFLDRGILFAVRGDYETAIAEFTEALKLDGDLVSAYMLRGRAYSASATKVISVGDNFSFISAYSTGGKGLSSAQDRALDRAIADYTQAIRLDPNNALAYRERGRAYSDNGEHDKAIADYNAALRLDPKDALAYTIRGVTYSDKGLYDRAIEDYNAALRLDPKYARAYYNRGLAYYRKKDYDRAIEDYNAALRLDPNYAAAYFTRGLAYGQKGLYDRAIEDYTAALRLDPNYAAAYFDRGLAYYNKKDYDRAIEDYNAALRLDPNYAAAYFDRGLAYYYKKDYGRARADWEKALQLDPNDADARNNLEVLRGMGY